MILVVNVLVTDVVVTVVRTLVVVTSFVVAGVLVILLRTLVVMVGVEMLDCSFLYRNVSFYSSECIYIVSCGRYVAA